MLRLLDARAGSYTEVRPATSGLLRICAHLPERPGPPDFAGLRVLLVADLLARAAELSSLQALTALTYDGPSPEQLTPLARLAGALAFHPPVAQGTCRDASSALGGPVDVHLVTAGADAPPGGFVVRVGSARLNALDQELAGQGDELLAVRLALISVPYTEPADIAAEVLPSARETLGCWRRKVAEWAESPSKPMPPRIAEDINDAFRGLGTPSVLASLRDLVPDTDVPPGAKFEIFVYADRVLGLDLPCLIGR